MKLKLKLKGKEYDVEILEIGGQTKVKVGEKDFIFGEEEKEKISVARTVIPKRDLSPKEIKAPIAGKISGIFVKEDDFVKKDQKILTLASMKMENEIISDFEGKIKKILVKEGKEVKAGEILIILS